MPVRNFCIVFRKDGLTLERLASLGLNDRQVKAVLHLKTTGRITSADYQRLTTASRQTATRDLDELAKLEVIRRVGTTGRGTYYVLNAPNASGTPQECPRDRTRQISRLSFSLGRLLIFECTIRVENLERSPRPSE